MQPNVIEFGLSRGLRELHGDGVAMFDHAGDDCGGNRE